MEDLQKQFEALQLRSQEDHRELEQLRTAQAAPTFVVQRERKLRRFSGTEDPLLSDWAFVHSCAEVERRSSGQLPAQLPRWRCPTGGPLSAQRREKGCRRYSDSTGGCLAIRKTPTSCSVASFTGSSCPASRLHPIPTA